MKVFLFLLSTLSSFTHITVTSAPSSRPTAKPSSRPTAKPSHHPSKSPQPSSVPSSTPSCSPSVYPSSRPSEIPSSKPSSHPTITGQIKSSTLKPTWRHNKKKVHHSKKNSKKKGKKSPKCGSKKSSKKSSKKRTKKPSKSSKKPSFANGTGNKSPAKVANASLCTDATGTFLNSLGLKKGCTWLDQDWKLSSNCGTFNSPVTALGKSCKYACRDFSNCACTNRDGLFMSSVGTRKSCDWFDGAIWKFTNNCGTSSVPPTELGLNCRLACSDYNDCAN